MSEETKRWRGLVALARDATVHASHAIEKVQLETAKRPFWVLEQIPVISLPTRVVHEVHDATVGVVHVTIRTIARGVLGVTEAALHLAEREPPDANAERR